MLTLIEKFDILNTFTGRGIFYVNNTMALTGGDLAKALSCEHIRECHFLLELNMKKETWKDVVGYEKFYSVSNLGRVKNSSKRMGTWEGRIRKQQLVNSGYLTTMLSVYGKTKRVTIHSMVAAAFIGKRAKGMQVNHKDTNRLNNKSNNLEYLTPKENTRHGIKNNKNIKLRREKSRLNRTVICSYCNKETVKDSLRDIKKSNKHFCNKEHQKLYFQKKRKTICKFCKNIFYPERKKGRKFPIYCSMKCYFDDVGKKLSDNPNYKYCLICKKQFQVKPNEYKKRKTCSYKCMAKWYKTKLLGKNNPHWKDGRYSKIADIEAVIK